MLAAAVGDMHDSKLIIENNTFFGPHANQAYSSALLQYGQCDIMVLDFVPIHDM